MRIERASVRAVVPLCAEDLPPAMTDPQQSQQSDVVDFLSSPAAHGGAAVQRVETHASIIFLAGSRALKLKRAVRYDYLDFSTLERRRISCDAEFRINRRIAPSIYRGVVAVTREANGGLAIDGEGAPVDWVVDMVRFDEDDVLDRRATRMALDRAVMAPLARAIAHMHQHAERRPDHGGRAGMAWVIEGNATDLGTESDAVLDAEVRDAAIQASREALARHAGVLDARRDEGWVRQCHGDLHLRNIVLIAGEPTPFDAVEFNDRIACIDVLYDLAFLLMDLWRRDLPRHANAVWNGYLAEMQDHSGLRALPLFLSCRAAVRAKTNLAAARLASDAGRRDALRDTSREYLGMALRLLQPPLPCLVAIGGYSGSGKSSLAYALAPSVGAVPGAVVLRSDEVRKRLLGVTANTRLGPDGYTGEVNQRVYQQLAQHAAAIIGSGHAAVVDAVFTRPAERDAIEGIAREMEIPFIGLWLDASADVLLARVSSRRGDVSDADVAVVRQQLAADIGPIAWHRLDASQNAEVVADGASDVVKGATRAHE